MLRATGNVGVCSWCLHFESLSLVKFGGVKVEVFFFSFIFGVGDMIPGQNTHCRFGVMGRLVQGLFLVDYSATSSTTRARHGFEKKKLHAFFSTFLTVLIQLALWPCHDQSCHDNFMPSEVLCFALSFFLSLPEGQSRIVFHGASRLSIVFQPK